MNNITVAIFDEAGVLPLARWGYFVATCHQCELTILCIEQGQKSDHRISEDSDGTDHAICKAVHAALDEAPAVPVVGVGDDQPDTPRSVRVMEIVEPDPLACVLAALGEYKTDLLIVRKHKSSRSEEGTSVTARELFERATCATLLLRPGEADPLNCKRILVPVAGGPHAVTALDFGRDIAVAVGGLLVPIYVVSGYGEDDLAVGGRVLQEMMKKTGVEPGPNVEPEVVMSSDVFDAIGTKAGEGFDLVIMGASNVGSLRKLLFGTIPNRLLSGDEATAIGVIRHPKPMLVRVQETLGRWLDLVIPQLEREDRVALFHNLHTKSVWSFDFMALIALATSIAALGLIQNSAAVVIGAMLVAPLMTPMLGAGLALVQGNLPLMKKAAQSIILGYFLALAIGMFVGFVHTPAGLTNELAARGGHSPLDFSVALLSGMAAAYCVARPGLSAALAGVAIAAALVPPIATTGISLVAGETANARGSALLFGTNLVAIILGASISFYGAGIRGNPALASSSRWVHRTLVGLLIFAAVLFIPLGAMIISRISGHPYIDANREQRTLANLVEPMGTHLGGKVTKIHQNTQTTPTEVDVYLSAPEIPPQKKLEDCASMLEAALDRVVLVRVHTELVITVERPDGLNWEPGEAQE